MREPRFDLTKKLLAMAAAGGLGLAMAASPADAQQGAAAGQVLDATTAEPLQAV